MAGRVAETLTSDFLDSFNACLFSTLMFLEREKASILDLVLCIVCIGIHVSRPSLVTKSAAVELEDRGFCFDID